MYVLVPMVIAMLASASVKGTFNKYSEYKSGRGITAARATEDILRINGLQNVRVERIEGELTDHFDPKSNVIRLSQSVYDSTSVAAIGVAAHEAGHAVQYARGYSPIKVRNAIAPVANISSRIAFPVAVLGLFMGIPGLLEIGIILYLAVVLFTLITLPVEFNASRRAIVSLDEFNILSAEENAAAKKVLRAAAMTYVASVLVAAGSLLRLLSIAGRRD